MTVKETREVEERFLRAANVIHMTGLSRSTIWRLEQDDQFPKRVSIGPRAVAWRKSEILRWMEAK